LDIDFELLRKQKKTLVTAMDLGLFKDEAVEHFAGVINMLDDMQDYAVDSAGFDHKDVFGKVDKDGNYT